MIWLVVVLKLALPEEHIQYMCVHVLFLSSRTAVLYLPLWNFVFLHLGWLLSVLWPVFRHGSSQVQSLTHFKALEQESDILLLICWWGIAMESNMLAGNCYCDLFKWAICWIKASNHTVFLVINTKLSCPQPRLCCHTTDCQHWASASESTLLRFNIALELMWFFFFLSFLLSLLLLSDSISLCTLSFPFALPFVPPFCPFLFFRCGLSGRFGLPQGLGYAVLDQLHYLDHHPPHCGSEPLGCCWPTHCGHHVRRWPP